MRLSKRNFLGGSLAGAGALASKAAGIDPPSTPFIDHIRKGMAGDIMRDVGDQTEEWVAEPVRLAKQLEEAIAQKAKRAAFGRIPLSKQIDISNSQTFEDDFGELMDMKSLSRAGRKWIGGNRMRKRAERRWYEEPDVAIERIKARIEESEIGQLFHIKW